jgi:septum formation protein
MTRLILASGSPRRRELLEGLGLDFEVRPVDLDESALEGEGPTDYVLRLADSKARALAKPGELVLAADTIVLLEGRILGKPTGPADARDMLRSIAGRRHEVLTGVAVHMPGEERTETGVERSVVRIARITEDEVAWYVGTEEPLDKAGSYAIQGLGALFVEEIDGNYTNVVGLPLPMTRRLFRRLGHDLLEFGQASRCT